MGFARNDSKSISPVKSSIMAIASAISRSGLEGSLKGKRGLACSAFADAILEGFCGRQIKRHAKNIGQTVFHTDHIEQGNFFELSHSAIRSTSDCAVASPRATEPNTDRLMMPALFSSCSWARNPAMICSLSISALCHKVRRCIQPLPDRRRPAERVPTMAARSRPPPFPSGQYGVIYCNPPWAYGMYAEKAHYDCMSSDALKSMRKQRLQMPCA
jgi:hypothetical protein